MTAPLFNVKARFSEYVTSAENGNVVEITKHGKTTAVIIGIDEYNRLSSYFRPSFVERVNEWKLKTGGLSDDEYSDFARTVSRNKEAYAPGDGVF